MKKNLLKYILTVCCFGLLAMTVNCSSDDEALDEPKPDLVIAHLTNTAQVMISTAPTFDISGSFDYNGAENGVDYLRVTSAYGLDLVVPVEGLTAPSGLIIGSFTFTMINNPGTYEFTVWIIDGSGRSSNKLTGSFQMIEDPSGKQPTPVTLESVTWDNAAKSALLLWSKNTDDEFDSYVIRRHLGNTSTEINRITDQNVTSTHDPENHGTIGFSYSYTVDVVNKEKSATSNSVIFSYPLTGELPVYTGNTSNQRPLLSRTRDEMYVTETGLNPTLKAVSTRTNTVLRTFVLQPSEYANCFTLSEDESKMYIVSRDSFIVLNALNFDVIKTAHLNFFGRAVALGKGNRLYVSCYSPGPAIGHVKILNPESGAEIGDLGIVAQTAFLAVSPDLNTLFVADQSYDISTSSVIYQVDVSNDIVKIKKQCAPGGWIGGIQVSDDGESLYVMFNNWFTAENNFIAAFSTSTLETITKVFVTSSRTSDFVATPSSIFVSHYSDNNHHITQFDISTSTVLNKWELIFPGPNLVQVSQDQAWLYAFYSNYSWIVSLSPSAD